MPDPDDADPIAGAEPVGPAEADATEAVEDVEEAQDGRAVRAERRRVERREAIVTAAKRVFRDKGYHQASVHDIIDEARIARGTFYLYFASKQEVFGHLIDVFLQLIRGQVRRISLEPGADAPLDQLRANFRRVVNTVITHEDLSTIILRDPTSFDEESRARVNVFFDQVRAMITDALRVGQGLRLVRPCNVHLVGATALGGLLEALQHMLMAHGDDPVVRARERAFHSPEAVADELMAFFLRGMSPAPAAIE
jgi:AcrR family transcriptional regulator